MALCGVEIKANEAVLALVQRQASELQHLPVPTKKIALEDDEQAQSVKAFRTALETFVQAHQVTQIAIKKRSKKGEFAGGPVTFKIEGIIQLLDDCEVSLLSPQSISATQKKQQFSLPDSLNKYQHEAFLTACTALFKQVAG
ncbi:MAG: DUF3010 family protein [Pseudomonas sp.]|uniref:DUF3010 family protein n=1 Tax=Pseudomonas sp. TaxID=306 RepID=UPI00339812D8